MNRLFPAFLYFEYRPRSKRKIHIKSLLASMKTLHNIKDWFGSRIKISVPASLSVIGKFSPMSIPHWMQTPLWMQNKPALFYMS